MIHPRRLFLNSCWNCKSVPVPGCLHTTTSTTTTTTSTVTTTTGASLVVCLPGNLWKPDTIGSSFSPLKVPPPLCYLKVNCKNINLTSASRVNLIKVLWLTDESFPNKKTDFANSGSQQKYWPRTINTPLECQMGNFSGLVVVILKHCHLIFVGVLSDTRPQRGWLVGGWSNAPISCITGTSWYQLSDYWLL